MIVRVLIREQDRHAYLVLCDAEGAEVPCWMVSDGTLRLLALTLIAHLPGAGRTYLVEEPENGLSATAVKAAYRSISSIADAQVLVASHSPAFVGSAEPKQLLSLHPRQRRRDANHRRGIATRQAQILVSARLRGGKTTADLQ